MVHYDFPGFQMTFFGRVQRISQASRTVGGWKMLFFPRFPAAQENSVFGKIGTIQTRWSLGWTSVNGIEATGWSVRKERRLISASSSGWFDCQGCPISLKHSATRPGQWPANMAMGVVKISNPRIVWKPPTSSIWQHLLLQSCSDPPFFWFDPHFLLVLSSSLLLYVVHPPFLLLQLSNLAFPGKLLGSSWEAPRLLVLPQRGDQCHVLGVVWELNPILMSSPGAQHQVAKR